MLLVKLCFSVLPLLGFNSVEKYNTPLDSNPIQEVSYQKELNKIQLNVPLIKQNPELKYGCEVTSLTMVLNYAGVKVNKMELYRKIKKDSDPLIRKNGDIIKWGDPSLGFVGDMTGKRAGYAVFDKPMEDLVNQYLPERAINLTDHPFSSLEKHVKNGYPVVVWTTGDYRLPDRWESWMHNGKNIKTPLDLHAVVLVGYDNHSVYLNDPLSGKKNVKVNKKQFIQSWHALKSRAISYR
ncbi:MAG TPA: C39 family peptidase [Niallia sp.]|nr:C39 family peptidase [Niallia sp.]